MVSRLHGFRENLLETWGTWGATQQLCLIINKYTDSQVRDVICLQAQNGLGGNRSVQAPAVSLLVVNGSIGIPSLYMSRTSFINTSPALGDRWALELLTSIVSGPTWLWARPWIVANSLAQVHPARPLGNLGYLSYSLTYPHRTYRRPFQRTPIWFSKGLKMT